MRYQVRVRPGRPHGPRRHLSAPWVANPVKWGDRPIALPIAPTRWGLQPRGTGAATGGGRADASEPNSRHHQPMTAQEALVEAVELTEVDSSARAGLFLGAIAIGASFQPNLLTRATRDQTIISGLSTATAYGVATVGSSILKSIEARIPADRRPSGKPHSPLLASASRSASPPTNTNPTGARRSIGRPHDGRRRCLVANQAASATASPETHPSAKGFAITAGLAVLGAGRHTWPSAPQGNGGAQLDDGTLFEDSSRTVRPD